VHTPTNTLPELLASVRRVAPPAGRVLSVYLDASPARATGQAYLITFRDLVRSLREKLPDLERKDFEAAVAQAEDYLRGDGSSLKSGIVLFASGHSGYFYVAALPWPPTEEMAWERGPVTEPLVQMVENNERLAVVLFDAREARILTVYLGEVEERRAVHDDVPGKHHGGGWAALEESREARHRLERVARHAERVIAELLELAQAFPFDRLVLGGPPEAMALFSAHLPTSLVHRLVGRIKVEMFASESEVIRAAQALVTVAERHDEAESVNRLFDGETTGRVTLGLEETLDALSKGRVHTLVVADTFEAIGGECPRCRRLVAGPGPCPICATPLEPVADLADRAISQAVARGAVVEVVSADAAALLATREGIGAWTR